MYLDHVIVQYEALAHRRPYGCTEAEIDTLEQQLGFTVPAAYREFLRWAGHDPGDIFLDLEDTSYTHILEFQAMAPLLVQDAKLEIVLPDDAVIIQSYDSSQFTFIRASEGEDPCVYHFLSMPTEMTYTFENTQTQITKTVNIPFETPKTFVQGPRFSEWLADYIQGLHDGTAA
jgi:SMI1 / KNR4 family (SUKH-1)